MFKFSLNTKKTVLTSEVSIDSQSSTIVWKIDHSFQEGTKFGLQLTQIVWSLWVAGHLFLGQQDHFSVALDSH